VKYNDCTVRPDNGIEGTINDTLDGKPLSYKFSGHLHLMLIREAWERGCDFEWEADGYGAGQGTMGDWSGIRDSSKGAKDVMLTKALNHLFGGNGTEAR
jgi:hypothetical protein